MPEVMERRLKEEAKKKGLTGTEANAFIYGTMRNKTGWKPKREEKQAMYTPAFLMGYTKEANLPVSPQHSSTLSDAVGNAWGDGPVADPKADILNASNTMDVNTPTKPATTMQRINYGVTHDAPKFMAENKGNLTAGGIGGLLGAGVGAISDKKNRARNTLMGGLIGGGLGVGANLLNNHYGVIPSLKQ